MINAIKICGIKDADSIDCAARAGASHVGFAFIELSPRYIEVSQAARLAARQPALATVALTMNASDDLLRLITSTLNPSLFQLHGDETPSRAQAIRAQTGIPVMKAIPLDSEADVAKAHTYEACADVLLFDAKPAFLPGGNGQLFDWNLITGERWSIPWMLSGGLTPENVGKAIYQTRPPGVDVSSGVEVVRGIKDCQLISAFVAQAKSAFNDIAQASR